MRQLHLEIRSQHRHLIRFQQKDAWDHAHLSALLHVETDVVLLMVETVEDVEVAVALHV